VEDHGRKEGQHIDGTAGSSRTDEPNSTKNRSIFQDKNYPGNKYKAEGHFTKACVALSMGCNKIQVDNKAKNFFLSIMTGKNKNYPEDYIPS